MLIRDIREDDIDLVYALMLREQAERPPPVATPDRGKIVATICDAIADGLARVAETDTGEIAGLMLAVSYEYWFSRDKVITQWDYYVAPEHRGGRAAAMLLFDFLDWSSEQDAIGIVFPIDAQINNSTCNRMMAKLGFHEAGTIYAMGAK